MKPWVATMVSMALVGAGCSPSSHTVIPWDPGRDELAQLNQDISSRTLFVTNDSDQQFIVQSATLNDTMLLGFDARTLASVEMPRQEITGFVAVDSVADFSVAGAKRGAFWGGILGGTVGLLAGAALLMGSSLSGLRGDANTDAVAGAAIGVCFLGALIGYGIGGASSSIDYEHYRFEPRPPEPTYVPHPYIANPIALVRLQRKSLIDENPESVCIVRNGKRLRLPKSEIMIEDEGGYIWLTVPARLLTEK